MLRDAPPRSKSLIITIFGDSLHSCISGIWLSELVQLLEPLAVNAQLARTSAFRLAAEHWLQSERVGRSSRYTLTSSGRQRVENAYGRIYDPPAREWDRSWTLVIPGKAGRGAAAVTELRRELAWEGFGRVAGKFFLHPRPDLAALNEVLTRLNLASEVAVLRAQDLERPLGCSISDFTAECWNLDRVAGGYLTFLRQFRPVLPMLKTELDPRSSFMLQTLLIHSFRRVVLHDPRLPPALLSSEWPGLASYDLCREIYRRTHAAAQVYLAACLGEPDRATAHGANRKVQRFGELL